MLSFGKAAPGTVVTPLKRGAIATRADFSADADHCAVYSPSAGKPAAPIVMAEGSRYEHLRLTAGAHACSIFTHRSSEKLMQQQTLTKSASEVMVRSPRRTSLSPLQQERIAVLERGEAMKEVQLRTLREERSKLSAMLSNEQKVFQKLEFELQIVQTLEGSLKEQIMLFEKRMSEGTPRCRNVTFLIRT